MNKDEKTFYDYEGKMCIEDRFINTRDLVKFSDLKGLLGNSVLFGLFLSNKCTIQDVKTG